jgi:soluble lytic murein transglycosylase-like protein
MANTPGVFVVEPNPAAKSYPNPLYAISAFEEVSENRTNLEKMAFRYQLNPDFVKAIAWMESTHGWYDRMQPNNKTIRPMNVHETLWNGLGIDRNTLKDHTLNVAAGVHILAAIWQRTADATPEKVATLYNQLGATKVTGYGKTVAYYMAHKPWIRTAGKANTFRPPCQACHEK